MMQSPEDFQSRTFRYEEAKRQNFQNVQENFYYSNIKRIPKIAQNPLKTIGAKNFEYHDELQSYQIRTGRRGSDMTIYNNSTINRDSTYRDSRSKNATPKRSIEIHEKHTTKLPEINLKRTIHVKSEPREQSNLFQNKNRGVNQSSQTSKEASALTAHRENVERVLSQPESVLNVSHDKGINFSVEYKDIKQLMEHELNTSRENSPIKKKNAKKLFLLSSNNRNDNTMIASVAIEKAKVTPENLREFILENERVTIDNEYERNENRYERSTYQGGMDSERSSILQLVKKHKRVPSLQISSKALLPLNYEMNPKFYNQDYNKKKNEPIVNSSNRGETISYDLDSKLSHRDHRTRELNSKLNDKVGYYQMGTKKERKDLLKDPSIENIIPFRDSSQPGLGNETRRIKIKYL